MVLTGRAAAIALVSVLPIAVAPWPAIVFLVLTVGLALAVIADAALAQSPASLVISRSGGAAARLGEPVDTVLTVRNAGTGRMRGSLRDAWPPSALAEPRSHPLNLPAGAELVAPSAIVAAGEMYTDAEGPKPHPVPRAMTADDVEAALGEYVAASKNAIEAGFDGVELHGANGYLIDQFLNPKTNQRDDAWGGSPEARNRFAIEAAKRTVEAIGRGRVGIRISPYGVFNDLGPFDGIDAQYEALAAALGEVGIAYVHLVDHSAMGAPPVSDAIKQAIRKAFGGTIILSGGYDAERAEADLAAGKGELVAFGRPFLANPDLLARFEQGAELNAPKMDLFYTPGPEGYTDYPTL